MLNTTYPVFQAPTARPAAPPLCPAPWASTVTVTTWQPQLATVVRDSSVMAASPSPTHDHAASVTTAQREPRMRFHAHQAHSTVCTLFIACKIHLLND